MYEGIASLLLPRDVGWVDVVRNAHDLDASRGSVELAERSSHGCGLPQITNRYSLSQGYRLPGHGRPSLGSTPEIGNGTRVQVPSSLHGLLVPGRGSGARPRVQAAAHGRPRVRPAEV